MYSLPSNVTLRLLALDITASALPKFVLLCGANSGIYVIVLVLSVLPPFDLALFVPVPWYIPLYVYVDTQLPHLHRHYPHLHRPIYYPSAYPIQIRWRLMQYIRDKVYYDIHLAILVSLPLRHCPLWIDKEKNNTKNHPTETFRAVIYTLHMLILRVYLLYWRSAIYSLIGGYFAFTFRGYPCVGCAKVCFSLCWCFSDLANVPGS